MHLAGGEGDRLADRYVISSSSEETLLNPTGDADVMLSQSSVFRGIMAELGNIADTCSCYKTVPGCVSFFAGLTVTRSMMGL